MIPSGAGSLMLLAHGLGGRQDLPIPFWLAVTGAAVVLVASFVALGALWTEPRLGGDLRAARPLPAVVRRAAGSRFWPWWWRGVGLAVAAYFCLGLFGPDTADNPTAGAFYVLFWVGLVPLSLALGPVWRGLNPLRTVHLLAARALRRDPRLGLRALPDAVGYWPAVAGLLAFVWLELVAPERTSLTVIGGWLAGYAGLMLAGATVFGSRWFDRGDAFEVYSALVGRLAPVVRRRDGMLVWRNPLDGMSRLRPAPGLVALVVVLLGSTMYDSVSNAPVWVRFVQGGGWHPVLTATVGLATVIAVVLAGYVGATTVAGRLGGRAGTGARIAYSIVPIAVGYVIAHYYSLLLLEGQHTLAKLSDPLVIGADWLGTGGWTLRAAGTTPMGIAVLQVTVIVVGHVLGVVLAHDRALVLFARPTALLGQLPLLALMVGYTVVGLLLLFAG